MATSSFVSTNLNTQPYRTEVKPAYTIAQRIAYAERCADELRAAGLNPRHYEVTIAALKGEK